MKKCIQNKKLKSSLPNLTPQRLDSSLSLSLPPLREHSKKVAVSQEADPHQELNLLLS